MSSIADIARAEAEPDENEEAHEGEGEPTPEPEPEPEPAPEPPASQMTEQEREREYKKLEKLAMTYLPKAVTMAQSLGMPIEVCPLCEFPGLAIPRDANEVTSDVEATVLRLIGKSAPAEFKDSDEYEMCDKCDGWGEVLTGARKEISRTAICNPCGGKGFKPVVQAYVPAPANGAPQYPGADVAFTPLPQGVKDAWGRPAGHVHWGIDPAAVGV